MTKKLYFREPVAIVTDHYKDLVVLHNDLAKKVWVGAIKIPLHIFIDRAYPRDGLYSTRVSLRTDYYGYFIEGNLTVVDAHFGSAREAAKFAKRLQKRFNITSIEI